MYIKSIKNMQFNGYIFKICSNIYFIEYTINFIAKLCHNLNHNIFFVMLTLYY